MNPLLVWVLMSSMSSSNNGWPTAWEGFDQVYRTEASCKKDAAELTRFSQGNVVYSCDPQLVRS
jgi:hypothetical protein